MCDVDEDLRFRIITGLQGAGVSAEVAGMVATEVVGGFMRDRAGERILIAKSGAERMERSRRDMDIRRDFKQGERVQLLARRYRLSRVRIWQIVSGA